jgi:internalin A
MLPDELQSEEINETKIFQLKEIKQIHKSQGWEAMNFNVIDPNETELSVSKNNIKTFNYDCKYLKNLQLLNASHNLIRQVELIKNQEENSEQIALKKLNLSSNQLELLPNLLLNPCIINNLTFLDMSNNLIKGEIAFQSEYLTYLNFQNNFITLLKIKTPQLTKLRLAGNDIKNLSNSIGAPKIKYLYCSFNVLGLEDSLDEFSKFTQLEELHIGDNRLIFLESSYSTSLNILQIRGNFISNLPLIKGKNLKILSLDENFIENIDILNESFLPLLEKLEINNNLIVNLFLAKDFPKLIYLSANNNYIQNIEALKNSSLKILKLNNNPVTSLKGLETLKFLEEFYFNDNNVNAGLDFREGPTSIKILELKHNALTELPKGLYTLIKLEKINLSCNLITDISILENFLFTELEEFLINSNLIEKMPLRFQMPKLTEWQMQENKSATNRINLEAFNHTVNLITLSIESNDFKENLSLENVHKLKNLYMCCSQIEDERALVHSSRIEGMNKVNYPKSLEIIVIENSDFNCQIFKKDYYTNLNLVHIYNTKEVKLSTVIKNNPELNTFNIGRIFHPLNIDILVKPNEKMKKITLHECKISEFPVLTMNNLEELHISKNPLKNIKFLYDSSLMNLKILSANYIDLTEIYLPKNNKSLVEIELYENDLTDINCLNSYNLHCLEKLVLGHNNIKRLPVLNSMCRLKILGVNSNNISDMEDFFASDLKYLKELNMASNYFSHMNIKLLYETFPHLIILDIKDNCIQKPIALDTPQRFTLSMDILEKSEIKINLPQHEFKIFPKYIRLFCSQPTQKLVKLNLDVYANEMKNSVVDISLTAVGIEFPKELLRKKPMKIKNLVLKDNSIEVMKIFDFYQLTTLTKLHIENIILISLPDLTQFPRLEEFLFSANQFTDISSLECGTYEFLIKASITENPIEKLCKSFNAPYLQELKITTTILSNVDELKDFNIPNLTYLDISSNRVTHLPKGIKLPRLSLLSIHNNYVTDLKPLVEMGASNLLLLDISNNYITDRKSLEELGKIAPLQHLNFNQNLISGLNFENFPNLNILSCSSNPITDLSSFTSMKYIKEPTRIQIENNNIVIPSDREFGKDLFELQDSLTIFNISNNYFFEFPIKSHANLKELYLNNCNIIKFDGLKKVYFPNLFKLEISAVTYIEELGDKIAKFIERHTTLELIIIDNIRFASFSLNISLLKSLKKLTIENTCISNIESFHSESLQIFNISNNCIKDISALEKLNLPSLKDLNIDAYSGRSIGNLNFPTLKRFTYIQKNFGATSYGLNNMGNFDKSKLNNLLHLHLTFYQVENNGLVSINFPVLNHLKLEFVSVPANELKKFQTQIDTKPLKTLYIYITNSLKEDFPLILSQSYMKSLSLTGVGKINFEKFTHKLQCILLDDFQADKEDFENYFSLLDCENISIGNKEISKKYFIFPSNKQTKSRTNILTITKGAFESLPDFIGDLDNLYSLHVSVPMLSDISLVNSFSAKMSILKLVSSNIVDISAIIGNLHFPKNLIELHLGGNEIKNIEGLDILKKLYRLNLENNNISEIPILYFHFLRKLDIEGNEHISNIVGFFLQPLAYLLDLDISKNNITYLPNFSEKAPKLQIINMNHNKIQSLTSMQQCTNLCKIYASHNEIDYICKLEAPKIYKIDLSYNKIANAECLENINLRYVKEMNISGNLIKALIPLDFRSLVLFRVMGNPFDENIDQNIAIANIIYMTIKNPLMNLWIENKFAQTSKMSRRSSNGKTVDYRNLISAQKNNLMLNQKKYIYNTNNIILNEENLSVLKDKTMKEIVCSPYFANITKILDII